MGDPGGATGAGGPIAELPVTGLALGFTSRPVGAIARYTGTSWDQIATVASTTFGFAGAPDGMLYVVWLSRQGLSSPSSIEVARFHR